LSIPGRELGWASALSSNQLKNWSNLGEDGETNCYRSSHMSGVSPELAASLRGIEGWAIVPPN